MQKVIECVPNFSEGQRKEVIDTIAHAIAGVEGVALLDIDPGLSTNRTIYSKKKIREIIFIFLFY
jgi:glutamate formiminotransferase/formiminotetrahydrofolate cyclodeaminase